MKSAIDVKTEINELVELSNRERVEQIEVKASEISKRKKRLQFLEIVKKYLESNPTKDFLLKEKARLEGRVQKINDEFAPKCKVGSDGWKDELKEYNKTMGVPPLKDQLKTIQFILN